MEKETAAKAQHLLVQLRAYQTQAETFAAQKQQLEMQQIEVSNALEALEKTNEPVFRAVGPVLLKTDKAEMEKTLKETKETNDVRLESLKKQEGRLKAKIKELTEKIMPMIGESS